MTVNPHVVLVVEDDQDIREALLETLEDLGYAPVGAANGKQALRILNEAGPRPCVIFLDMMMPVMDGRGFREEQLRHPGLANIPVVMLSAHPDVSREVEGLQVADFLRKPLDRQDLVRLARKYCEPAIEQTPSGA